MNQTQGTSRSSYAAVGKKPDLKHVQSTEGVTWQYVILAIATTGLNIYVAEICQLGLFYIGGQQCFKWCEHILPEKEFDEDATNTNGFYKDVVDQKCSLCWKDKIDSTESITLPTNPVKKVMKSFRKQIRRFALGKAKRVMLMVYNARYDVYVLFRTMIECGVSPQFLVELNIGFVDVLELVKSMSCKLPGIDNFKQRTVYNYLFNDPQDKRHVHDVHRDMMTLFNILNESKLSPIPLEMYLKHSTTAESRYKRYEFNKRKWEDNRCNRMSKRRVNSQTNTPKTAASGRNYNYDVIKKKHKAKGQPKFKEQMKKRKISKATSKTVTERFRSEPHMYNIAS